MPEPEGSMTAPTFEDDPDAFLIITSAQLRRVEVTANRLLAERTLKGDGYRDLGQYLAVACEDAVDVTLDDHALVRVSTAQEIGRKADALDAIHMIVDGNHCGGDQLEQILRLLTEVGYTVRSPDDPDPLDTFQCSGCMVEYGQDQLHRTCGECAADFCHPCWTNHYDKHDDQLACMPGLSAEALGADAEPHDNNCPGTVGGEMCRHPSHAQEQ